VKVLVVDDDPDARILTKRLLEDCGATVATTASVEEALERVGTMSFDVIVSDVGMPDHDGYEFLKKLRAQAPAAGGRIPAVALTAFARSADRTRAMLAGFDVHVARPVEPIELCAVVARLAGRTGEEP
jgi:CheY-like chemotaxis protein